MAAGAYQYVRCAEQMGSDRLRLPLRIFIINVRGPVELIAHCCDPIDINAIARVRLTLPALATSRASVLRVDLRRQVDASTANGSAIP